MTFLQLQQRTASWLSRDVADFTANSFDSLKQAINDSQSLAQRLVDFDYALTRGYLPLTSGTADYTTAMLDSVGGSAVSVQKIHSLYSDSDYLYKLNLTTEEVPERVGTAGGEYVYKEGTRLYYRNSDENLAGIYTKYFAKLADLSADGDNNFLTNNCGDWMALQAAFEMLHYIKEDERVQLSAGLLRYKWDSVIAWNESFEQRQDLSLD